MKVMTVLGTRPEIIRLSRVIAKLDQLCDHVLVHTGQNFDTNLNDIFFQQLAVRSPDYFLDARGSIGAQVGSILSRIEPLLQEFKPDRFLILGDTNSALSVIIAKRLGIPVYHMEAGNRCFDDRVPEEVNRRIIDHSSDILLPYTERSRQNLISEGIKTNCIYVTGNPILEVIKFYEPGIQASDVLNQLGIESGKYFLVTMHRAENVDVESRLRALTESLGLIYAAFGLPVIISTHPHTKSKMESYGIYQKNPNIRFLPPFGFFDFIQLERNAKCLLSDSGTVQEEACIFSIPNVTLRDVTERPETIECGSNVLSGADPATIFQTMKFVCEKKPHWFVPREYLVENVSDTIIKIVLGFQK